MAMDNFLEEVATKRNRGMETAMYVLANVLMVFFGALAFLYFMGLQGAMASGASFVQILIGVILIVFSAFAFSVEFHPLHKTKPVGQRPE